jgi:hypothetical protein
MKTGELRLGNYVKCGDKTLIVTSINIGYIEFEYIGNKGKGMAYTKAISPLLLTEDILLKLGAKKDTDLIDRTYYRINGKEEDIYILYEDGIYYHAYEYDSMVYSTYVCTGLHTIQLKETHKSLACG